MIDNKNSKLYHLCFAMKAPPKSTGSALHDHNVEVVPFRHSFSYWCVYMQMHAFICVLEDKVILSGRNSCADHSLYAPQSWEMRCIWKNRGSLNVLESKPVKVYFVFLGSKVEVLVLLETKNLNRCSKPCFKLRYVILPLFEGQIYLFSGKDLR